MINPENTSSENINSEAIDPQPRTLASTTMQFCLGAVLGCIIGLIPLSYFQFFTVGMTVTGFHIVVLLGITLFCGVLSAIWGNKVSGVLIKLLESTPLD